jgi:DNA-binding beta-propeller fold protein YncE
MPPNSAVLVSAPTGSCLDFGYQVHEDWAQLPAGWSFGEVAAVATDARDCVYVFNRGTHPVIVFSPEGAFLRSWGEGVFVRPHGICIGQDDTVWCSDDNDHTVRQFTLEGKVLQTLGTRGKPSDTGATSMDFRTIRHAGPPFHYPTNLAIAPKGDLYVSDGYGNARVHRFSAKGRLLFSWGEPGSGAGQFHIPHGIAVDREGIVYVADRENSRIQLFTPEGQYLSQWTDVARPCEVFIDNHRDNVIVAELGYRAGMWPGTSPPCAEAPGGRLSIFTRTGQLTARWGGGLDPCAAGDFFAPHDVWGDSRGSIYVGEVVLSGGGNKGLVPVTCHTLQKFVRRDSNS